MDKNVTLIKLLMTREDSGFPVYKLPENFTFRMYQDGMEHDWARIEASVGEFADEGSALTYFKKEFLADKDSLCKRMIFALDETSRPVGTITAWYGDMFGDARPKLHWFAVTPEAQGRGLAKPLLTRCMEVFLANDGNTRSYLGFQTWSYKAARLYAHFGYSPYCGACPPKWVYTPEEYERTNYLGWAIVTGKILELLVNKKA